MKCVENEINDDEKAIEANKFFTWNGSLAFRHTKYCYCYIAHTSTRLSQWAWSVLMLFFDKEKSRLHILRLFCSFLLRSICIAYGFLRGFNVNFSSSKIQWGNDFQCFIEMNTKMNKKAIWYKIDIPIKPCA